MQSVFDPDALARPPVPPSGAAEVPYADGGWAARLELCFARTGGATRAVHRVHHGPLRVQRMLYPEGPDCCHALLLHPPGGIAGGDRLAITVGVDDGAAALLTSPGATKWYRSGGPPASQAIALSVADRGCLEWLPQESILFDGACAEQQLSIELAPSAAIFGWDIVQLGRLAAGEQWRRGYWRQRLTLRRGGQPVWQEQAALSAADRLRDSPLGLAGHAVFATAWAAAPALCAERERALGALREFAYACSLPCGIGWLPAPAELLLIRVLGHDAQELRALLERLWHILRPWTAGRPPRRPRIWST